MHKQRILWWRHGLLVREAGCVGSVFRKGIEMWCKFSVLAVVFSILASSVQAEMIVINGRYTVAKESIRAYFYRERNKNTVFDVRWSDWSTQYRCGDLYDRTRVEAASLNFALQIGESRSLDFLDFLSDEGFEECEQF